MRASLVVLLLTACSHSTVVINNAQPNAPLSGNVNATGAVAAALLVTTAAIAATQEVNNPQPVPPMAPEREVAEQDCTQPIDISGNLRCR